MPLILTFNPVLSSSSPTSGKLVVSLGPCGSIIMSATSALTGAGPATLSPDHLRVAVDQVQSTTWISGNTLTVTLGDSSTISISVRPGFSQFATRLFNVSFPRPVAPTRSEFKHWLDAGLARHPDPAVDYHWVRPDNIHGYVYGRLSQVLNVLSDNDGRSVADRRVVYDNACRAIDKDLSLAEKAPFGLSQAS